MCRIESDRARTPGTQVGDGLGAEPGAEAYLPVVIVDGEVTEGAYLSKRHGPDHPNRGSRILVVGDCPANIPHTLQEAECSEIRRPTNGLCEVQDASIVRIAHRPDMNCRRG